MPIVPIDVTTAGLIKEGQYIGTIDGIKYQIKTGEKWNSEGTTDATFEQWNSYDAEKKRLQYSIAVPGSGKIFHDLYMAEKALGFVKDFYKKCEAPFNKEGFDTDAPIGRQIGLEITIKDDPTYGEQNVVKFVKAG